jgi:hypothetical protein
VTNSSTAEDFARAALKAIMSEIDDERTSPANRPGLQLAHVLVRVTANKLGVSYE